MEYSEHFAYRDGRLYCEDLPVSKLADDYGTPLYIYSRAAFEQAYRDYDDNLRLDHMICYSVKTNSNLAVLQLMASLGSGFDIVSGGELARVVEAGGDAGRVVYSGVGKRDDEIAYALDLGIYCFNVESEAELEAISRVAAAKGKAAPVAFRVNPDVDPHTHHHIATGLKTSKFGVPVDEALRLYEKAAHLEGIRVRGLDCHIGSQLTTLAPFEEMAEKIIPLAQELNSRYGIEFVDVGGGLGINYANDGAPNAGEYAKLLNRRFADLGLKLVLEPGRSIAGNSGVLAARVTYLKRTARDFAVVDAGMNDMIRPALYSAWMNIDVAERRPADEKKLFSVVGPICESGDKLGEDRELAVKAGDVLVQFSAGAYGFSMSSNYNSRPRAAEIMVDKDRAFVIRQRETVSDLWRGERLLEL